MDITRIRKPRCYLLHALAPESVSPREANQTINAICADKSLPLALYHDHFIGQPGGVVIFYAETAAEREALQTSLAETLATWAYHLHPMIFSYSPAALDAQIAYTLSGYRDADWDALRQDKRPAYGDLSAEANSAEES